MSIVHESSTSLDAPLVPATSSKKKLNRIAEVRREQGVSLRSVSRQMGKTVSTVRAEEDETNDLTLSELLEWQEVLGVPLQDLMVDPSPALSKPVMERARLVRIMKTAAAIHDSAEEESGISRLATMLVDQLVEVMPELADVSPWHSVGQRRSLDEYGRIVERRINDDLLG